MICECLKSLGLHFWSRMKSRRFTMGALVASASILLAFAPSVRVEENKDVAPKLQLVNFRLVHEEVNGGADSAISPDGKWISFTSRRSGNPDIWIVNVETGELRQITDNAGPDYEAHWHPDGSKLVFVTERWSEKSQDVYMVDLETGAETPIATEAYNEDYPAFSKDGKEIVFTGGPQGFREVQVYNSETGKIRTVTRGYGQVGAANFSPDGKSIVFHAYYWDESGESESAKSDIFVVPSHGGDAKPKAVNVIVPVNNVTQTREDWDYKPNWSFNGEWIVFSSKRATPNFNLFLMKPDGSSLHQITNVKAYDLRWAHWTRDGRLSWHQIDPQEGHIRAVEVATGKITDILVSEDYISDLIPSPDGTSILYETRGRIYVLPTQVGAEPRELTRGVRPRWSHNGKSVSFLRRDRDAFLQRGVRRMKLFTIPLAGGEVVSVAATPAHWPEAEYTGGWSPDGKTLAVVSLNEGHEDLVLVSQDSTKRAITHDGKPKTSPVWSLDGSHIFYCENKPQTVGYYITTEKVIK